MERSAVDLKIVRALCANGIPFNVLRNPQFCDMVNALRKAPEGYKAPSSEKARTVLLDECVRDVEKDLIPFKEACRVSMFMYATDFSGVEKTDKAIAQFLSQAIDFVGPSNVLSVVTDNAANCKAAGKEVEKMETSKLELLRVAKTRFASLYVLLKRLFICRDALSTTIARNSWRDWVKHGNEHTRTIGQLVGNHIRDDDFWIEVENILRITKPIYRLIKFCDGEGPKMGGIYEKMDNMLGEIQDVMKEHMYASYFPQVQQIVLSRWEKMSIPLHCLGFALTPRFYDSHYLETLAPGGTLRKALNLDKEVVQGVMEAFNRISENRDEERLLREQFATFNMKKGLYSLSVAQMDAVTMEAIDWWSTYGVETPELADVAKKVLSQPISSSSAERNWSTYSYIHNVKRNRLSCKRADKLVFVHSNIRLSSRFTEEYKEGSHKKWDMDPKSTNLEGSRLEDIE
ncbi:hypothetical protein Lser_V15G28975 [Lactuca serriola]